MEFRKKIVKEVVEDLVHPGYLSKKYSIPAVEIRTWVAQAGQRLPKTFKTLPLAIWATESTNQPIGKDSAADVPAKLSSGVQQSFSLSVAGPTYRDTNRIKVTFFVEPSL